MMQNIPTSARGSWPYAIAFAAVFTAACSVLPPTELPPHRTFDIVAIYSLEHSGQSAFEVPSSDGALTITELRTEPATRERFDADGRRFRILEGLGTELRVFCRGTVYGTGSSDPVPFDWVAELFPGATEVVPRASDEQIHP